MIHDSRIVANLTDGNSVRRSLFLRARREEGPGRWTVTFVDEDAPIGSAFPFLKIDVTFDPAQHTDRSAALWTALEIMEEELDL